MSTDTTALIVFDDLDVQLVVGVLREAVERAQVVIPDDPDVDSHSSGVTLGGVTSRWTRFTETGEGCEVINFDGERLFAVRLIMEERVFLCGQLSHHAAQLAHGADLDTLEGTDDMERAEHAFRLMTRISEAA
ncbi:hypothetical protein ACFORH_10795 [Amycolatopsis roodepoortensis]|uniref:GAF domain-containing protein n=1 Tax=Amycolatopsis roodepoortensis TaxID=700274 RepID=A0ABR9LAE7_9PSEU|nr:hypothetical protein [Amycolatopsis roodepoortensis]MBE1577664.1 GAF domain-containing protein [Amycolatopsis roodepoortensis]